VRRPEGDKVTCAVRNGQFKVSLSFATSVCGACCEGGELRASSFELRAAAGVGSWSWSGSGSGAELKLSQPRWPCADQARYEYVRSFEQPDSLLPNTFIVVRIDGRGFTKYAIPPFIPSFRLSTRTISGRLDVKLGATAASLSVRMRSHDRTDPRPMPSFEKRTSAIYSLLTGHPKTD
jgi:hypothetical protein